MTARYIVDLTASEREQLIALTSSGSAKARRIRRARILLMADAGVPSVVPPVSWTVDGGYSGRASDLG